MKILPFKIAKPVNESFWVQNDILPYLYDILHQHDEIQITLIQKSTGNVIVGNRICTFEEGDIFVFGTKLPHAFRNDPAYYHSENQLEARALSIYFKRNIFGTHFWELPETKILVEFMQKAVHGLYYIGKASTHLAKKIEKLATLSQTERLIMLLTILHQLASFNTFETLSTEGTYSDLNETDEKRMDAIFRFTLNEFHRPISLKEVAGIANMTVNSFCRYFKARTRKSYLNFLTEFRIGQACKLLQQKDHNIANISHEVGFGNLSNFNRKFKEIIGCTPKSYRKLQKQP